MASRYFFSRNSKVYQIVSSYIRRPTCANELFTSGVNVLVFLFFPNSLLFLFPGLNGLIIVLIPKHSRHFIFGLQLPFSQIGLLPNRREFTEVDNEGEQRRQPWFSFEFSSHYCFGISSAKDSVETAVILFLIPSYNLHFAFLNTSFTSLKLHSTSIYFH